MNLEPNIPENDYVETNVEHDSIPEPTESPVQSVQPTINQPQEPTQPQLPPLNYAEQKLHAITHDKLFLAICILLSVSFGLSFFAKNFNVITLLQAIFFWLLYSKRGSRFEIPKYTRMISGTIFAKYIIYLIACTIITLSGLASLVFICFGTTPSALNSFLSTIITGYGNLGVLTSLISSFGIVAVLTIPILIIVVGLFGLFLNAFGRKNIHSFVKSLYKSAQDGTTDIIMAKSAGSWCIVYAVINGLVALSSTSSSLTNLSLIVNACSCASYIIFCVLIRKYFLKEDKAQNNI